MIRCWSTLFLHMVLVRVLPMFSFKTAPNHSYISFLVPLVLGIESLAHLYLTLWDRVEIHIFVDTGGIFLVSAILGVVIINEHLLDGVHIFIAAHQVEPSRLPRQVRSGVRLAQPFEIHLRLSWCPARQGPHGGESC